MTNYEKLRKLYNDTFYPEGVPLEFGCEVKTMYKHTKKSEKGAYFCNKTKCYIDCVDKKGKPVRMSDSYFTETGWKYQETGNIKNLGKPLTLQDVLRLLNEKSDYPILVDDKTLFHFDEEATPKLIATFDIDLSIPFHEQPEEVFEKIYQLVKE